MPQHKNHSCQYAPQARSGTSSIPSARHLRILAGVTIVVLAALLAYLPSISGGFIFDDDLLLTNNRLIKAPDGLRRFWCTAEATDYWPVTNTTLWFEWRLWKMNPLGYHVTNLFLHILAALLVWLILRKLSLPGAFWAALIFAVHPVNVESVAWISSRKNLLAMLFFLLSIVCYLRQFLASSSANAQRSRHTPCADPAHGVCGLLIGPWYWLSLLAFVLAMLSKGSVAVLPLLLLGIIWWQRMGTVPIFASAKMGLSPSVSRWDLVRTAPFFVVAVVLAGVNMWFQTHGSGKVIRTAGFVERLLGAGTVVWVYLYKALLPVDLAFVYPQWHIQTGNLLWWLPLMAAVVVTAVLWGYRRVWSRPFLFAWGFFCVSLVPVLGFTDVGFMRFSPVADRYQHVAILGMIALAAAGWGLWHERTQGVAHRAAIIVAIVAAGTLTFLTFRQSGLYRDAMTLYQATLDKNPDCWFVHNNLGSTLIKAGRPKEAIEHYQQALRLKPDYPEALNNLGSALSDLGRLPEAIEHYQEALRLKSDYVDAYNNLGVAFIQTGRTQEAIEHYRQALRLDPNNADAHNNLGNALVQALRSQEAIEHYQQALLFNPDFATAHYNLGIALTQALRPQEACEHFQQTLRLQPNYAAAHNNLGNALMQMGRTREAFEHFHQSLRLQPDYVEAHNNLGNALIQVGRPQEAIEHYRQALKIKPDFSLALYNLGVALLQTNQPQEAIKYFQEALRLEPNYAAAHNNLGNALIQAGRPQEAIEHYGQALKLKPDLIEVYYNLALTYASIHQSAEAIAAAQKALDLARSKGQTALAKRIEDWLNSYRASLSDLPHTESLSPSP